SPRIVRSSELGVNGSSSALLLAICRQLEATEYLSGISGRAYLDYSMFENAGVKVRFQEFYHPVYRQYYEPFVPAMSSIDLLFNYGGGSLAVLENSDITRLSTLF